MEYPKDPYISIHYKKYLGLEQLLSAQRLRSEDLEKPAHDEMLFIIIHQVYELWFKQIIHELESVNKMFKNDYLDERSIGTAVERLDRVIVIFELLVQQIKVLETMTPMDFLEFRSYLFPASGFQSFQFRKMEVMLGLPADQRITYNNKPYHSAFSEEERTELEMLENNGSLVKELIDWLERIPFLQFNEFSFLASYKEAVGTLRFSYKATIAALFIKLYKDEPILQLPNLLLERLIDVEELLTVWRYRHAQMVLRMLGKKIGTGGSSGHTYLAKTAEKHHIFHDLYNLSTMMIPRGDLPELPEELRENLGFLFTKK